MMASKKEIVTELMSIRTKIREAQKDKRDETVSSVPNFDNLPSGPSRGSQLLSAVIDIEHLVNKIDKTSRNWEITK